MNKLSTKQPISSPNRTDHFPPPLMNYFLRTDTGNRSRTGRSRFSPIFIKKKNISHFETTLEPSSPQVTCMGQIRSSKTQKTAPADNPVGCRWVWFRTLWKKRVLFFRSWNSSVSESRVGNHGKEEENDHDNNEGARGRDDDDDDDDDVVSDNMVSLPPKNALILTRCRSAPYRSSNLYSSSSGYGLWSSSTMKSEEEEGNKSNNERETEKMKGREEERESSPGSLLPLILTRCKSQPALRVSDKLLLGI